MQKIGLFGGTFDPVHLGHLITAEYVLNELNLDKIYFIPAHKHALKSNNKITSPSIRLEILKIALKDYSCFEICDIELQSNKISYTIDTLTKFKQYEGLPKSELYYIIGFDNLSELHLWKDYQKIWELANLVVLARPGEYDEQLVLKYKEQIIIPNSPKIDISSTLIRNNIKENKSWQAMVPSDVYKYIEYNKVYK